MELKQLPQTEGDNSLSKLSSCSTLHHPYPWSCSFFQRHKPSVCDADHKIDTNTNFKDSNTGSSRSIRRENDNTGYHSYSCSPMTSTRDLLTFSYRLFLVLVILSFSSVIPYTEAINTSAFFNSSSSVTIPNSQWNILKKKQVTFRTCTDSGNLLYMRQSEATSTSSSDSSSSSLSTSSFSSSSIQELKLSLHNTSVYFTWITLLKSNSIHLGSAVNDNRWYTIRLKYLSGQLQSELLSGLNSPRVTIVIANATLNPSLLDVR